MMFLAVCIIEISTDRFWSKKSLYQLLCRSICVDIFDASRDGETISIFTPNDLRDQAVGEHVQVLSALIREIYRMVS